MFRIGLLTAVLAITLGSCSKDDNNNQPPADDTTTSFSAKIDGETYTGKIIQGAAGDNNEFGIAAQGSEGKSMAIGIVPFDGEKTYQFGPPVENGAVYIPDTNNIFNGFSTFFENGGGSVTVTSWNSTDSIISGTFSYTAENASQQTLEVTEGSFKNVTVKYDPGLSGPENNNEFSVDIDGTPWSTSSTYINAIEVGNTIISITAGQSDGLKNFSLFLPSETTPGTYDLGPLVDPDYTISYSEENNVYFVQSGSITITQHNQSNKHIESVFNFVGSNGSNTIDFTNGEFSVDYE